MVAFVAFAALASGCHSAFVNATIDNQTDAPLQLVEVDYPSASFGAASIPAHSRFYYRFKLQGSDIIKLQYTDAAGKVHIFKGPQLIEGQEGTMLITVSASNDVSWTPHLIGQGKVAWTPPK